MNDQSPSGRFAADASRESELARVLDEYLAALERGERPSVEELIAQHPVMAEQLRGCLQSLRSIEAIATTLQPSSDESLAETQPLGDFELEHVIGRGGMGIVYAARQVSLDRRVAVKILPFAATYDDRHLQRFRNEAHAAATLDHPHIVGVYAVGCERGVHYYAMQYVDGWTLAEQIAEFAGKRSRRSEREPSDRQQHSSLPSSEPGSPAYYRAVAELGRQIGEALQHAHSRGVIHRDIKPSNVLLDREGHGFLADFGLAHLPADSGLTATGDVIGTLRHMSPEQALGRNDQVDQRSDIYALGLVLYELLTLHRAFDGDDRSQLLRRIIEESPLPPRKLDRSIPMDLETIVLKAISKQREDRYDSAQAMADDLRRFLDGQPVVARRPGPADRLAAWTRRRQKTLLAVTGVLLLLVVGLSISTVLIASARSRTEQALLDVSRQERETQRALERVTDAEREAREKLWRSHVDRALALSRSGQAGQRFDALAEIRKAVAAAEDLDLQDTDRLEMRSIAAQALALHDVRQTSEWRIPYPQHVIGTRADVVAGLSDDSEISIWRATDGRVLNRVSIPGLRHPLRELSAESKQGVFVVHDTAADEFRLELWDLAEQRSAWALRSPALIDWQEAQCHLSADGRYLAVASRTGLVVYACSSGEAVFRDDRWRSYGKPPGVVRFDVNGRFLAAVNPAMQAVIAYRAGTWEQVRTAPINATSGSRPVHVDFHPQEPVLAIANAKQISIWDLETCEMSVVINHPCDVRRLTFDNSGELLATTGIDDTTRFWDTTSYREVLQTLEMAHAGPVFHPDNAMLVATDARTARRFDFASDVTCRMALTNDTDFQWRAMNLLAIAPDANVVAWATRTGLLLWDLQTLRNLGDLPVGQVCSVVAHPTRNGLVTSGPQGILYWPITMPQDAARAEMVIGPPERLVELPDDFRFVLFNDGRVQFADAGQTLSVCSDSRALVIDLEQAEFTDVAPGAIELSPDGTAYSRQFLFRTEAPLASPLSPRYAGAIHQIRREYTCSRFSPDGRWIVCDTPREYEFVEVTSGETLHRVSHDLGTTYPVMAFAPGGETVILALDSRTIAFCEVSTGREIVRLRGIDAGTIQDACFDPTGSRFATRWSSGMLLVWNIARLRAGLDAVSLDWDSPPLPDRPTSGAMRDLQIDLGEMTPPYRDEGESLLTTAVVDSGHYYAQNMTTWGSDWSGGMQLFHMPASPEQGRLRVLISLDSRGDYDVTLYFTRAPDFGDLQVSIDGDSLGTVLRGYEASVVHSGAVGLGTFALGSGFHEVAFTIAGKHHDSSGYGMGIDAIEFTRVALQNGADAPVIPGPMPRER